MMSRDGTAKRRRLIGAIALVTGVIAPVGLSSPAGAATEVTEIAGTLQVVDVIDEGRVWQSGPIWHARRQQVVSISTPDPESGLPPHTVVTTVNVNFDTQRYGEGRLWGAAVMDFGDGGFEVTFTGDISPADVPGGFAAESRLVGHGFGSFAGTQLRATTYEIVAIGFATWEGVLFSPGAG